MAIVNKAKLGIFIAGDNHAFDIGAAYTLQSTYTNFDIIGGSGSGATIAAFFAAGQIEELLDKSELLAEDVHKHQNFISKLLAIGTSKLSKPIIDSLNMVALRNYARPVVIPAVNSQYYGIEVLDIRNLSSNAIVKDVLRSCNSPIDPRSKELTDFDGGLIDVYAPLSAMVKAGATRIILITSALPFTSNESCYQHLIHRIRHNEIIRALCLCQAEHQYLQIHLVAPIQSLTQLKPKERVDHGKEIAERVLKNFNAQPPNPEFTAWSAVEILRRLADRQVRSTGVELEMDRAKGLFQ